MKSTLKTFILISIFSLSVSSCRKGLTLSPVFFQPTTYTSAAQLSAQPPSACDPLEQDQLYGRGYAALAQGYDLTPYPRAFTLNFGVSATF